jgi:hypothetical protein
VRVDRQLTSALGGVPGFGPPKSKAGFRTVPMPEVVCATLAEHLARYGPGPAGLVFTNTFGRPLRRNTVGDMWHRAALQASLPEWATFHDYADIRVMPTFRRSPYSLGVSALKLSA